MKFRRLSSLLASAVLATGLTLGTSASATAATCGGLLPLAMPACGALWGISVPGGAATLAADEATVGRKFDIVYDFHQIGDTLPTQDEINEVASGHLLHVNIESTNYAAVISGAQDAAFTRQALGIKSLNAPVYVTFSHEPDVKTKASRGTPAQYVAAWQHVHDLFVANGATNAVWVWVMVGWYPNFPGYAGFYPGNSFVDWISWEGYAKTGCSTGRNALTSTFADAVGPMYAWLHDGHGVAAGIDISKPEMISEYDAQYDSGNPAAQGAWLQGIPQLLKTQFPDIKAVAKWDYQGGNCNYEMAASPLTVAGFTAAGHDPYVNQTPVTTGPPQAAFSESCAGDSCSFDASASTAPGSSITSYDWDFGDGTDHGTGETPAHTYAADGSYNVTLTVTNENTDTGSVTQTVVTPPPPPVAAFTSSCLGASCSFNGSASSSAESSITSYSWDFGDGITGTGASVTHTYTSSGSFTVTLTVTDTAGNQGMVSHQAVSAAGTPITFVAGVSTTANATSESVKVPAGVTSGDAMLLVATGAGSGTLTAPTGWTKIDTASVSSINSTLWKRIATSTDAGMSVTVTFPAIEHGTVQLLVYAGTNATNPVVAYAKSAVAKTAASYTSPTTTVPANGDFTVTYWGCKSSTVTSWTVPAGQTVRSTAYGTGGGRITSVFTDAGAGLVGTTGGYTASPDVAATAFAAWTIVLG